MILQASTMNILWNSLRYPKQFVQMPLHGKDFLMYKEVHCKVVLQITPASQIANLQSNGNVVIAELFALSATMNGIIC